MQFSWAISFLCTYMCILSQSISSHFWVLRAPPWHWLHGLVQSSSCSAHLFHPVPDQGDVNYLSLWVKQLMGSTLLRNINKVRAHSSNSFGFIICFWGANFYMLLYVMICSKSLVPFEKKKRKKRVFYENGHGNSLIDPYLQLETSSLTDLNEGLENLGTVAMASSYISASQRCISRQNRAL